MEEARQALLEASPSPSSASVGWPAGWHRPGGCPESPSPQERPRLEKSPSHGGGSAQKRHEASAPQPGQGRQLGTHSQAHMVWLPQAQRAGRVMSDSHSGSMDGGGQAGPTPLGVIAGTASC